MKNFKADVDTQPVFVIVKFTSLAVASTTITSVKLERVQIKYSFMTLS